MFASNAKINIFLKVFRVESHQRGPRVKQKKFQRKIINLSIFPLEKCESGFFFSRPFYVNNQYYEIAEKEKKTRNRIFRHFMYSILGQKSI